MYYAFVVVVTEPERIVIGSIEHAETVEDAEKSILNRWPGAKLTRVGSCRDADERSHERLYDVVAFAFDRVLKKAGGECRKRQTPKPQPEPELELQMEPAGPVGPVGPARPARPARQNLWQPP